MKLSEVWEGKMVLVWDPRYNEYRKAVILEVYGIQADVRFEADKRKSEGHFIEPMKPYL